MPTEPIIEETPAFVPYEVAGIGTVEGYEGADYLVRVPSGALHAYRSPSGTPSEELAAEEIAYAIANPPAFPNPVPASVTRRQLFLWLNSIGITRAMLRAQLAGNEAALIELDEATEFRREHPLVAQLGQSLGLGFTQIDDAFRAAAQL